MANEYYWRHYSPGNIYVIIEIGEEKTDNNFILKWELMYSGSDASVSIEKYNSTAISKELLNVSYDKMSRFPFGIGKDVIKAIFTNLEIS